MTASELAAGVAFGLDPPELAGPPAPAVASPIDALRDAVAAALSHPPCVVSFSGGRDSSAMLALAARVARERGLPPPIAATLDFPGDAAANEEAWQRIVLKRVGTVEWEHVIVEGDAFDAIGPIARDGLLRHGLLWPFNAHFHVPIMRLAAGGTLVTGFGGDELSLSGASRAAARIMHDQPRHLRDAAIVGFALAPDYLRRVIIRRRNKRSDDRLPWLTQRGVDAVADLIATDEAVESWRWDRMLAEHFLHGRYFRLCREAFDVLGSDYDTRVVHPFLEPSVLAGLGSAMGAHGPISREALVRSLFGDLLPEQTIIRSTKASFTKPLWTRTAMDFARGWSGESPAGDLVDPDALRRAWLTDPPDARSASLLQAAWLLEQN